MGGLADSVDRIAGETGFSGVVRVDRGDVVEFAKAYGLAHRGCNLANAVDGQFGIASGTKGLTALTVVNLIEQGRLDLATTARSVLRDDLALIDDDVTVEQLLAHRSGIGDYVDEDAELDITDYVLSVPFQELATTESYVPALDGHVAKFSPGERFSYCNSGYVVLALIAERTTGTPFHDLVTQLVCEPAGMRDTAFLRSDELPSRAAVGYLASEGSRSNVFHLPVRGSGDGGIYSTAADIHALWAAFFAGRIVSREWVAEMVRPRSNVPSESLRYGLGFWLHESQAAVVLEGEDAGVSFRSVHDPVAGFIHTVLCNTSSGAWPIARRLEELLPS
ncbi:MAG: beta-lactamase family protein [Actinomycetota bacterium]|jgi:CubicO group peptidase (beta-lactamase class C family)|nr:beta-lactamase family protein [Actinomycetota bacterium]